MVFADLSGANTPLPTESQQVMERIASQGNSEEDMPSTRVDVRWVDSKRGLIRSVYNLVVSEWRAVLARQSDVVWLHNFGPVTTGRRASQTQQTNGQSRIRQGRGEHGVQMSLLFDLVALSEASRVVISIESPAISHATLQEMSNMFGRLPNGSTVVVVGSETEDASSLTPALIERLDGALLSAGSNFRVSDLLDMASLGSYPQPIMWGPTDTTLF